MAGQSAGSSVKEASRACRRLCSLVPLVTLGIILALYATTVWTGWIDPINLVWHGRLELIAFTVEVLLLVSSYLATILRGPGFVPLGWTPSADELARLSGPVEEHPLDATFSARDGLQYCTRCKGFKPPRAHHCSNCGRCVLWMDHHCPWTNTCVGHRNLKSFVLFVHYVTLACAHSFFVQSEAPVRLALLLYKKKNGSFWRFLSKERTIFALISWVANLVIALLVGSLAWDMHWTLGNNTTMLEEMITEKAQLRRTAFGEQDFVFPYDLGSSKNWRLVMGSRVRSWFLPVLEESEGIWPQVREGNGHFSLSTEQLAQKALRLSKSMVMPVARAYDGRWGCCFSSICRCYYWAYMTTTFGCGTGCCSGPACDELHLTVSSGDRVVVSLREEHWIMGRVMAAGSEGPDGPEGWLPSCCVDTSKSRKFEVPHQRQLQGQWTTRCGNTTVAGPIVFVAARHDPFVLRSEGSRTVLLGCTLEECDGITARWSSGDVWHRPEPATNGDDRRHSHPAMEGRAWMDNLEAKKDL